MDELTEFDVACHVLGCSNAGYRIRVFADPVDTVVVCGVCGTEITDVEPLEVAE